jgi:hypothetical protein
MDVDHAGEERCIAEVDDGIAGLRLHLGGGFYRNDAIAGDHERLRIEQAAGVDIHQMSDTHQCARGLRPRLSEADSGEDEEEREQR